MSVSGADPTSLTTSCPALTPSCFAKRAGWCCVRRRRTPRPGSPHDFPATRRLFECGLPLFERVPADVRADIELFVHGGLAILRKIEGQGYNVLTSRPALGKLEKLALVGDAALRKLKASFL